MLQGCLPVDLEPIDGVSTVVPGELDLRSRSVSRKCLAGLQVGGSGNICYLDAECLRLRSPRSVRNLNGKVEGSWGSWGPRDCVPDEAETRRKYTGWYGPCVGWRSTCSCQGLRRMRIYGAHFAGGQRSGGDGQRTSD